jgi:lipoate-protein ligase A
MNTNLPPTTWRLIDTGAANGAWNMAADEAILESIGQGEAPPTLRLYTWQPPCLSLGYAQPFSDVATERLAERGWDVVRRMTGGRAILHTDELTYSVTGPKDEPRLVGGVLASYRRLSQALLQALLQLEVPAEALPEPETSSSNPEQKDAICFKVPSNYEITVGGKKLIGSAQARKKAGVLQHGSLPLYGDLGRIAEALVFPDEATRAAAARRLLGRATTVQRAIGRVLPLEMVKTAFIDAFSKELNLTLVPAELSEAEQSRAESLVKEKYAHPSWTERI